ncbi:MAG: MATE family efflux transporter [Clostridia bacterium]|nr:MATE family efflux transporter [Clostridia bacterium]
MNLELQNLKRDFLRYAAASMLAQWIFALYSAVDGMFVARGVDEVALSAVNLASPYISFLFSVSLLFTAGTSTAASIYLGKGEKEKADRVVTQNLILLTLISAALTLIVLAMPERIAAFLGATELTMPYVRDYLLRLAPFSFGFVLSYAFEVLLKTDGRPRLATFAIILGCLIHCLLDIVLILHLGWGIKGAATATGTAQVLLVAAYILYFISPKATLRWHAAPPDWAELRRVFCLGLPAGLTEFSAGITTFLFNHMILRYLGEEALISYTVISYVNMIVVMGMAGIAQGAQPMISYYYGRGEEDAVRRLLQYTLLSAMALGTIAFALSQAGAGLLVGLFIRGELEPLRSSSAACFRVFAVSFLLVGLNVGASGCLAAIERAGRSFAVSLARGLVFIAASLWALTAVFGGTGIWWAATLSEALCLALSLPFLRKERPDTPGGVSAGRKR